MRQVLSLGLAIIVVVFAASCTQELPVSPDVGSSAAVLAKIGDAPPASGPHIVRYEDTILLFHRVGDRIAILGTDVIDVCTGGDLIEDPIHIMDIDNPEDVNRIIRLQQGEDLQTFVWDVPFPANCGDYLSNDPVFVGLTKYINTDNDFFTFLTDDNKNANAFGFRYHGQGVDGEGGRAVLNAHSNCVWDGVDLESLKCKDKINVR